MDQDLLAETACARLMAWAIFHVDRHEVEGFLQLFHEDGSVELRGQEFRGHEAIRGFMSGRDPQRITRHILGTPCIRLIDAEEATGVAYFSLYEGHAEPEVKVTPLKLPPVIGEFHQSFRKGPDGWRIQTHRSVRVLAAAEHGK